MNLFGLVIGQHILLVLFALVVVALGSAMLQWGWIGKIVGILLFAGAVGWLASIILYDEARVPGLGVSAAFLFTLFAACYAAFQVYQHRDAPKRSLLGGRSVTVNRNAVIAGAVLALMVIVTIGFLAEANWESFFRFDDRAANQAREQTTSGILKFVNRLLRSLDQFLAR